MRRLIVIMTLAVALGAVTPAALSVTTSAATTTPTATAPPATLSPARGERAPASLFDERAIPQVSAAVVAAKRHAPVPKSLNPSLPVLHADNQHVSYDVANACQPRWGSGVTNPICRLGDPSAKRTVVLFGDSHAQMWAPALITVAEQQHFALVVMAKPGCAVTAIGQNTAGWPCHSWYEWALSQTRKLHPAITIVSDLITNGTTPISIEDTVADLRSQLTAVPRGVLLADPPAQSQSAATCLSAPGANLGTCSTPVSSAYVELSKDVAAMLAETHRRVIPVEQWFCSDGICPTVVQDTAVMRDFNHLSPEYSAALASVLAPEITRVLHG